MSLLTLLSATTPIVARGIVRPLRAGKKATPKRLLPQVLSVPTARGTAVAYTLTAAVGAFALTGQAATLRTTTTLPSSVGAFTLTGQTARAARSMSAKVGTFALAGQAATLRVGKSLTSAVGAFTMAGQPAAFVTAKRLASSVGAFTLSGQSAGLTLGKSVTGAAGAFSLTGQNAVFHVQRTMPSGAGAFVLTGKNATLLKTKLLVASPGAFALTGKAATLVVGVSQIGKNQVGIFPSPTNSTGAIDSNTVRANDNITVQALNAHDSDASIHMQSGLLLTRPVSSAEGATYFCTDTRDTYTYVSGAWVQSAWAHWFCSYSDYTDQTATEANTATKVTFNTTDVAVGFSLVSSSRMTALYAGVYNFQWSGQFTNSDASEQDVDVWIRINGADVVGSTGRVSLPKKHGSSDGHVLPGWNYYLTLNANDYVELYWAASNASVTLQTNPSTAWAPSTASIIATMTRV